MSDALICEYRREIAEWVKDFPNDPYPIDVRNLGRLLDAIESARRDGRVAVVAETQRCAREVAKTRHDLSLDPGVNGYFRSRYMPLMLRRLDALERVIRTRDGGEAGR